MSTLEADFNAPNGSFAGRDRRKRTLARGLSDCVACRLPWAVLVFLLAFGMAPFALEAVRTADKHQLFLGVAGVFPFDQDQYLAYVSSAHDGLIRNLYGLTGGAVFIDPVWSPSGIVRSLTGIGFAEVMAFWNVVGVGVLFAGCWRLVSRHISAEMPWRRSLALLLMLFGGMTVIVAAGRPSPTSIYATVGLDMVPAQTLWGYAPMAIAIGVMPFAIEGMERILEGAPSLRTLLLTAGACLLSGWLHPWQGVTLLLVWFGLLLWQASDRAWAKLNFKHVGLITVALVLAPIYFEVLPLIDQSWAGFSSQDKGFAISWQYLVYGVGPASLVALSGALQIRRDRASRGLLLWPLAVLVLVAARPPEILHCFDGIALPLGVLALVRTDHVERMSVSRRRGLAALRSSWVMLSGISAVLITIALITYMEGGWVSPLSGIKTSDLAASRIAAKHAAGQPVLTTQQLGVQLPIVADVATWSGDAFWTPDARGRTLEADRFFLPDETAAARRVFIRRIKTHAIIEPCGWKLNLTASLPASAFQEQTVGCAHVFWTR